MRLMASTMSLMVYKVSADITFAVENGESIASEGKGEYMYVEGRVLSTDGTPVSGAIVETWETDALGEYNY